MLQKPTGIAVVFRYSDPWAGKVYLAGTMNDWNPSSLPLYRDEKGNWALWIRLQPGKYEYKFIVDGQWTADPSNPQIRPDGFGGLNSVIRVKSGP